MKLYNHGKVGKSSVKMLNLTRVIVIILIQGAFQELKLYGSSTQAEMQCVNTFEVSVFYLLLMKFCYLLAFFGGRKVSFIPFDLNPSEQSFIDPGFNEIFHNFQYSTNKVKEVFIEIFFYFFFQ